MNNRYENIGILKTENGRRYKKTIKYPLMERNINDTYLIGARHDRLDNLANTYYDDSNLWWIIARANNIGKGNLNVPVGIQLRIPYDFLQILEEYRALNN